MSCNDDAPCVDDCEMKCVVIFCREAHVRIIMIVYDVTKEHSLSGNLTTDRTVEKIPFKKNQ